jgi:transposase-like protein
MFSEFRSVQDVWLKLSTEGVARDFLEQVIWNEGRSCPHCGSLRSGAIAGRTTRPGLYQCRERECRRQFTITTHTPMHATKLDLRVWIAALFLVITSSKGVSSVVMARLLGVSQKTAWKMGHAIRRMMDHEGARTRSKLTGVVEVDEAYVGGAPKFKHGVKNKRGKGTSKPEILIVAQREGEVRAKLLPAPTTAEVRKIVEDWVHPSATLMTDSNRIYRKIGKDFAAHHSVNHSKKQFYDKSTDAHINTAESFGSQIERALIGVYHRLSREHLQGYLDEIAWRWNRRQFAGKIAHSRGSSTGRHNIWRPVPALAKMTELLRNGRGRQLRRSDTFGIEPVDRYVRPPKAARSSGTGGATTRSVPSEQSQEHPSGHARGPGASI